MTIRPPSGDPSDADANEHGEADHAGAAATSFNAAQDLLQAALDEVRGGGSPPKPPTAPTSEAPASSAPKASARTRSAPTPAVPETAPAVAAGATAATRSSPGAPTKPAESAEFWAKPAPEAKQESRPESAAATPARRRRSAAVAAASQADEFDGLTDTLYQPTNRAKRRRRRPEPGGAAGAAGTLVAGGSLASDGADLDPVIPEVPEVPLAASRSELAGDTAPATEAVPAVALVAAAPADLASADATGELPAETSVARESRTRRTPWIIAAAVAAVLAVGALAIVVTGGGGNDQAAVEAGGKARLTFAPITTAEGATVTRTWELEGRKGDQFVGTLAITNPTSAPLATTYTEVIPKSIAANVSDITFDPQPVVIKADPVVEYRLTVPAGATTTATYEVAVAPDGVDRRRLDAWARELPQTTTTTTTTTTTAPPAPGTTTPTTPATTPNRPPVTTAPVNPTTPPTSPPEPPPTNPPATTGTISITVISVSKTGTFGYSTPVGDIFLTTSGAPDGFASWSSSVEAGSYTLTQSSTPAGFYLYSIQCSNGFSAGSGTHSAPITVTPGETVSCTFRNPPA